MARLTAPFALFAMMSAAPIALATAQPTILVLGDSISAAYGIQREQGWVSRLAERVAGLSPPWRVVNASISGETTGGGLARLSASLETHDPQVLIIELGGNDALRGQPLANTESNLREIVRRGRDSGAEVVLLGMDVPTNYGPDYASAFAKLYPRIAEEEGAVLVPGFVRELGADPSLLQPDGLHPTAEGQRRLAERLLPTLTGLLEDDEPRVTVSP